MNTVKEQIIERVNYYFDKAKKHGYVIPPIPIDFSLKGGCAGQAIHKKISGQPVKLRFNLDIAERNLNIFLNRTCGHEIAHLLQFMKNPNSKPHGHEWDFFCKVLTGSTMPRCHSYDTTGLKRTKTVKRYQYSCGCRNHQISTTIHNRIMGGRKYFCKNCKELIALKSFAY